MRPVNHSLQHVAYNPPAKLTFASKAVAAVCGTHTPSLAQVLDIWLYVVRAANGEVQQRVDHNLCVAATNTIKERIDDIYKLASVPLMDHLVVHHRDLEESKRSA
jgi:hypothetical protein